MRNEEPEQGTRNRNEERGTGTRNVTLVRGTRNPTTLSKWRNNTGERGPAMCVHEGTSDPVSRCIIRSKNTGNDVICHRKSRDVLKCLFEPCRPYKRPCLGQ